MSTETTQGLLQLLALWRKRCVGGNSEHEVGEDDATERCADELEAALNAPPAGAPLMPTLTNAELQRIETFCSCTGFGDGVHGLNCYASRARWLLEDALRARALRAAAPAKDAPSPAPFDTGYWMAKPHDYVVDQLRCVTEHCAELQDDIDEHAGSASKDALREALEQIANVLPTHLQNPASTELWAAKAKDCIRIARAALEASRER